MLAFALGCGPGYSHRRAPPGATAGGGVRAERTVGSVLTGSLARKDQPGADDGAFPPITRARGVEFRTESIGMNDGLPHIADWILIFGATHTYLIYAVIALLACLEGPWLALIFGVLVKLGDFYFLPVYTSLMVGDLVGDAGWYWIGRRYGHRFVDRYGKYVNVTEDGVARMTRLFHQYKHSVLFLSKISNGFGFSLVTLTTAGMVRIPFPRYMLVNLLGQFVWTGLLMAVGYYFTDLYDTVHSTLGRMSLVAAAAVLLVVGYRLWKYLRSRAEKLGSGVP
jgi:membrane-associated protein